jgi:hypothetical protein
VIRLTDNDLRFVVERLPRDIRDLLSQNPKRLYVGGGFVRSVVAGEAPSDVDIFGESPELLEAAAGMLAARRGDTKTHKSKNAITVLSPNRLPVQFITRWTFNSPDGLVNSFDFTVCQAAIWRTGGQCNAAWASLVGDQFYIDLAGRRLVYTCPEREEEPGGSMLRVIKFVRRGYSIQVTSLGNVIARLSKAVRDSNLAEHDLGLVLSGLLREVDPLMVIDGLDVADDHEPLDAREAAE